jgi:uncharacterized protein YoxC
MFKCLVIKYLEKIMSTQAELAATLVAIGEQIVKIGTETDSLIQKVDDLEAALVAAGGTTPEVDAALAAVKAQLQIVDEKVQDAP